MMNATPPKDGFIEEDGLRLHYVERGKAEEETVVFIHGVRDQCRSWDLLIEAWPPRGASLQHPVALDCAVTETATGPRTAGGYRHEDFLFDLGALFRHLNKQSAILIGHSLGGSTALLYAGCFPERVKSLVLLESLGPLACGDDELPGLLAKRLNRRDHIGIHFPYESLDEAAKARCKKGFH